MVWKADADLIPILRVLAPFRILFFEFLDGCFVIFDFIFELVLFTEFQQTLHAFDGLRIDGIHRFCVALTAQVKWLSVGFLQVITALHIALGVNAMLHRKHVACFVSGQLDHSFKALFVRLFARIWVAKSI